MSDAANPPIYVFDLRERAEPSAPGFYYSFDNPVLGGEVFLDGPHDTDEAARNAAIAFINDADTDHSQEAA